MIGYHLSMHLKRERKRGCNYGKQERQASPCETFDQRDTRLTAIRVHTGSRNETRDRKAERTKMEIQASDQIHSYIPQNHSVHL